MPLDKMARCGHVTASRIADVLATIKSGEATSRRNYRAEKVLERMFNTPQERDYSNAAMAYGNEMEAAARASYTMETGHDVEEVGFILHPDIPWAGASPDGTIGADGLLECKCPEPAAYLAAFMREPIDRKYLLQMQWQMACTGRQWCDYVVYRAGCDAVVQRVPRDEKMIAEISAEVRKFLAEVEDTLNAAYGRKQ